MEPAVQPKKIVQQSEQVFNPVKIPIIVNNQLYIMLQQDIRHIEETRHISYAKVDQNGLFQPVEGTVLNNNTILPHQEHLVSMPSYQVTSPQCRTQSILQDVINCTRNSVHATPGFPFHYTQSTSTSDINQSRNCCRQTNQCERPKVESSNKSCLVREVTCRGINTDKQISRDDDEELNASEKLKPKKTSDSSSV